MFSQKLLDIRVQERHRACFVLSLSSFFAGFLYFFVKFNAMEVPVGLQDNPLVFDFFLSSFAFCYCFVHLEGPISIFEIRTDTHGQLSTS